MSVLVITEKPLACKKIAKILDEKNSPKLVKLKNVEYYRAERGGKVLLLVPAIGHLFTVSHKKEEGKGNFEYPVFDLKWVPNYEKLALARKKNRQYYQYKNLLDIFKKVSQVCNEYIVACDYDIEGSTIGYKILEYCIGGERVSIAKRMKFSSLTEREIINSYECPMPSLNFNLIESGICRHEVDYLFGINLSHALTLSTTKLEKINFYLLTIGRVQGPTLAELVEREKSILQFIPEDYWKIKGFLKFQGKKYPIECVKKRFYDENEIDRVLDRCKNKQGVISDIKKSDFYRNPPVPYNLSGLQDDAWNFFKYNPSTTLKIAESLYLKSLISYPRTSNQVIPKSLNINQIIQSLEKCTEYKSLCDELLKLQLVPNKGKKTDPAHPPITPTGNIPAEGLNKTEKNIYNLIVYNFFSIFGQPAKFEKTKYKVMIDTDTFYLTGQNLVDKGWLKFNPIVAKGLKAEGLPPFNLGQIFDVELKKEKKQTKPPARYNPNSIRKWMEKNEIGTKSTRSEIIKKLYERKYIKNKLIEPTKIGMSLIDVLKRYVPEILSVEMTRELERMMNKIEMGEIHKDDVINNVKERLMIILGKFKADEMSIGKSLEDSIIKTYEEQSIIGKCPNCDGGTLKILYSKKTKKRFIGCSNYPKCTTSFPISQKGKITPLNKYCKYCEDEFGKKYPMVRLQLPKKRPFTTCVNWANHKKRTDKTKGDLKDE